MTLFADLEKLVSAEVDALMGEPTRIDRKTAQNQYFARSEDASRASVTAVGVVDFNPIIARPKDMGQYDGYQPDVAADRIHVSYAETEFVSRETRPREQDEIVLLDRDNRRLRVTRVDPDELGRMVCVCVPA